MAHLNPTKKKYLDELKQDLALIEKSYNEMWMPNYPEDFNHKFNGVYDFPNMYARHYRRDLHEGILLDKIGELETHPAVLLEFEKEQFELLKSAYTEDEFYKLYDVESKLKKIAELEKEVDELNNSK